MHKKSRFERVLLTVLIILTVLFFLLPVYWLLITAFKYGRDAFAIPPRWLFFDFTLRNFREILDASQTGRFLLNSIIVSAGAVALSLVLGVPAGYAIARSGSRLLNLSSYFFLLLLMVPPVAMLIPFYLIMRDLHLLGSYASLIILDTVFDAAFVVWMMRSYFADVPKEMEEASLVDGASRFGAFWRVALPLSVPGIVAAAIYVFIFSWNDFLFALMLTSPRTKTIPLGILASFSAVGVNWGKMAAMCLFAIIPALIISLFLNRFFIQGVTMGATKG